MGPTLMTYLDVQCDGIVMTDLQDKEAKKKESKEKEKQEKELFVNEFDVSPESYLLLVQFELFQYQDSFSTFERDIHLPPPEHTA